MWEVSGIQIRLTVSWRLEKLQEQCQKLILPDANPWAASVFIRFQPNDMMVGIVTLKLN